MPRYTIPGKSIVSLTPKPRKKTAAKKAPAKKKATARKAPAKKKATRAELTRARRAHAQRKAPASRAARAKPAKAATAPRKAPASRARSAAPSAGLETMTAAVRQAFRDARAAAQRTADNMGSFSRDAVVVVLPKTQASLARMQAALSAAGESPQAAYIKPDRFRGGGISLRQPVGASRARRTVQMEAMEKAFQAHGFEAYTYYAVD